MRTVSTIFLLVLLFSCDSDRLYEQNINLEQRYWKVDEPMIFDFNIEDSSKPYTIYYNVRNSLEYPYARLFIQYTLTDSTGLQMDKKLNSQFLFDQKTGKPLGQSGIGDVFDHQFLLIQKQLFNYPGKYQLKIEQFNRQDTLRGVLAVGARVEVFKTKSSRKVAIIWLPVLSHHPTYRSGIGRFVRIMMDTH